MTVIHAETALLPAGWARDVRVEVGPDGRIASVRQADRAGAAPPSPRAAGGEPAAPADPARIPDARVRTLLPAPVNTHSHAFQRAMAGRTERRGEGADSFWTWRREMFRFLDRLTPGDVEVIAALVQMEMAEAGYGACVEFHYLHHAPGGLPYDDPAEMAGRVVAAAERTGLGLTLLPVLYRHGGCDGRALGPGQVRFGTDPDGFARLHEAAAGHVAALPDAVLGAAPHSLRAAGGEDLALAVDLGGPIHMHLAEQVAEVEEVREAWGARPVEWLLDNAPVDGRWCLIHCTQMAPHETEGLARTGAVAGLCPITEANLGDGIFDGVRWLGAGGRIAVGSDSNLRIALAEELRSLEYSQRLRDRSRAALAEPGGSTGRRLLDAARHGGARAAGRDCGAIAPGLWADLLALDGPGAALFPGEGDARLDAWIFAGDDGFVSDVWSAGRHVVRGGRHVARGAIVADYLRVIERLA